MLQEIDAADLGRGVRSTEELPGIAGTLRISEDRAPRRIHSART
mgnify:CR=1 FL=1